MNEFELGVIEPKIFSFEEKFSLESGKSLDSFELIYETYGELSKDKDNAILICHALSGNHHAAGLSDKDDKRPGWWNELIGPGKAFDTKKYFVVSLNNLGGCHGSTGPSSVNPDNNEKYGKDFPLVTVKDWINSQNLLRSHLNIDRWLAVAGGSLGGMQALQWAIDYPDLVAKSIVIAAAPKLSAQNIAFNEVARQAIVNDPDFEKGTHHPKRGLGLARMLGHITYLSEEVMKEKFDRDLKKEKIEYGYDVEFEVESYLRYQADNFSDKFDAHTYLLMTKALDYFDPAKYFKGNLIASLEQTKANFLIISFSSDWRFSPKRSKEIVNSLVAAKKPVSYVNIESFQGHDGFLFPDERYVETIKTFLESDV